jgi:hypothetical protein
MNRFPFSSLAPRRATRTPRTERKSTVSSAALPRLYFLLLTAACQLGALRFFPFLRLFFSLFVGAVRKLGKICRRDLVSNCANYLPYVGDRRRSKRRFSPTGRVSTFARFRSDGAFVDGARSLSPRT